MKRLIPFFLIIIFVILGICLFFPKQISEPLDKGKPSLLINQQKIWVELAQTDLQRAQGLSGREKLVENQGMLFIFPQVGNYSFWMKEMKFDLDFVFINNKQVVDLAENVSCPKLGEDPQTIRSKTTFNQVLEINAGMIEKYQIQIGDSVILNNQ